MATPRAREHRRRWEPKRNEPSTKQTRQQTQKRKRGVALSSIVRDCQRAKYVCVCIPLSLNLSLCVCVCNGILKRSPLPPGKTHLGNRLLRLLLFSSLPLPHTPLPASSTSSPPSSSSPNSTQFRLPVIGPFRRQTGRSFLHCSPLTDAL